MTSGKHLLTRDEIEIAVLRVERIKLKSRRPTLQPAERPPPTAKYIGQLFVKLRRTEYKTVPSAWMRINMFSVSIKCR